MATIELWKAGHRRAGRRWKAWLSFALGIGLSLYANIASAPALNAFSIAVAACPPLALLLVELLNQALDDAAPRRPSELFPSPTNRISSFRPTSAGHNRSRSISSSEKNLVDIHRSTRSDQRRSTSSPPSITARAAPQCRPTGLPTMLTPL